MCTLSGKGQFQTGLHQGSMSGATGLYYNPASFQAGDLKWDVLLVSGAAFVEADYAYINNTSVVNLLLKDQYFFDATFSEGQIPAGYTPYYFTDSKKDMHNNVHGFVGYPAIALRFAKHWSAGFYVRTRMAFSANNISPMWSYPQLQDWNYADPHYSNPVHIAGASWTEIAFNAGYGVKKGHYRLNWGINVKPLIAHDALFAFVPNQSEITLYRRAYHVNTAEASVGFTDFESGPSLKTKGNGFAVDLGVVIEHRDEDDLGYTWRFSASVTDLGALRFNHDALRYHYAAIATTTINRFAYNQVNWIDDFAAITANQVTASGGSVAIKDAFSMMLPTSILLDFDYQFKSGWYANAAVARHIILHPVQLHRENIVAITVRRQWSWLEVGMPIVLYNDQYLRFGSWLRLGPVTIGSDHIGSLFIKQPHFNGSDIYFALRINDLNWNKNSKNRQRKQTPEHCYW